MIQSIKLSILQSSILPFDKAKLDYYIQISKSKGSKIIVLPEYVLNLFFKELETTPISLIEEQSKQQFANLENLAKIYNIVIVSPIVITNIDKIYKTITIFGLNKTKIYHQQILMPYPHWNEAKFFSNSQDSKLTTPEIFTIDTIKFAVISAFESHFDFFWQTILEKNVDCVIVPTANTFESNQRWRELLKVRAFTNNTFVIRVNRVGNYKDWNFYGDSFVCSPFGDIDSHLGKNEEVMVVPIDKSISKLAKKEWKFRDLLRSRDSNF
jgi:nitrilase